jgi:hypothetical protein
MPNWAAHTRTTAHRPRLDHLENQLFCSNPSDEMLLAYIFGGRLFTSVAPGRPDIPLSGKSVSVATRITTRSWRWPSRRRLLNHNRRCGSPDAGPVRRAPDPDPKRIPRTLEPGSGLMARLGVVAGKRVAAEVVGEVAPDGMDVVRAALGVVVFDQQPLALDPVIVRLAALGAAGPGEAQPVELLIDQARSLVGETRRAGARDSSPAARAGSRSGRCRARSPGSPSVRPRNSRRRGEAP